MPTHVGGPCNRGDSSRVSTLVLVSMPTHVGGPCNKLVSARAPEWVIVSMPTHVGGPCNFCESGTNNQKEVSMPTHVGGPCNSYHERIGTNPGSFNADSRRRSLQPRTGTSLKALRRGGFNADSRRRSLQRPDGTTLRYREGFQCRLTSAVPATYNFRASWVCNRFCFNADSRRRSLQHHPRYLEASECYVSMPTHVGGPCN